MTFNNCGYIAMSRFITVSNYMNKKSAINHFGTQKKLASALGISQAAISKWPENIPPLRAFQIEQLMNGQLRADPAEASREKV